LSVTFTPSQSQNYTTVTTSVVIQVIAGGKITPAVTWPTPAAISYGMALSGTQLNASASVPGSFLYSPAAGAVLNAGTQTLSVTFTPTDQTDYTAATVTVPLVVNKATTTTSLVSVDDVTQYHFSPTTSPLITQFDPVTVYVYFSVSSPASQNISSFPGTVTVRASTGESCTAPVSPNASGPGFGGNTNLIGGTCSLYFTSGGPRTVTATYGGDSNDNSSVSVPARVIVVPSVGG
jgi:hypothetical protein